ncbi:MAG: Gfo/Idh/MocA family oxidoreductase [Bacteroidota bacterium]
MSNKIRFGILSTAKIGRTQVIPAMRHCQYAEVAAIASNDKAKAEQTAAHLGITKAYGSYEALLADPDIDAVYIPLPNHLHVPYTLKAMAAGKHVLCEKPIAINAAEAAQLLEAAQQYPYLKVMEAFMYRFHPQWQQAKQMVADGILGEVKHIHSIFSYTNLDAANIRNKPEAHGGALMDIGCYCIEWPRFIFGREPQRVTGLVYRDPVFKTDSLTSALMDFGNGYSAAFSCSTQLEPYQRVNIIGSKGRLEIEMPCNAPNDTPAHLWLQRDRVIEEIKTETANQYTLQVDAFALAILNDIPVPTALTDALDNMRVIDALLKSAEIGEWVDL